MTCLNSGIGALASSRQLHNSSVDHILAPEISCYILLYLRSYYDGASLSERSFSGAIMTHLNSEIDARNFSRPTDPLNTPKYT